MLLSSALTDGHAHQLKERPSLIIRLCRGSDGDVESTQAIDLVVIDLREDYLLAHTEIVAAPTVETARRDPTEVPDARESEAHQSIQHLVHPIAAQSDPPTDRHAGSQLEVGDRLARTPHLRLLAAD